MQFTREEEEDNPIAFLDVQFFVHITRHDDGTLSTKVYRKPSNTNIGIKPQSCQDPRTAIASFKGELCRCHRLCSSPTQTKKEIEFVLDLYEDNGHDRAILKNIADTYTPPQQTHNNNRANNTHSKDKTPKHVITDETKSLFDVLPFKNGNLSDDEDKL